MRIWICDDNNEAISSLSEIIEEIGSHPLETFVDPVHMLKALKNCDAANVPEIVFLDIELKTDQTGFDVFEQISQINKSILIIFITAYSNEYAQEVLLRTDNPFGYLTKPFEADYVRQYLNKASHVHRQGRFLCCKFKGKEFHIKESSILYLESAKHVTKIVTNHGTYRVYEKISELLPRLSNHFIACHKSYLVNLEAVNRLYPNMLVLENGKEIPISRSAKAKVRSAFNEFLKSQMPQSLDEFQNQSDLSNSSEYSCDRQELIDNGILILDSENSDEETFDVIEQQ
ncbi:LytR/AlgR family response regulator transcription factor [Ileibacterium valens]|nr:LytTR family DNA-binding domain-containing protein [Ileibacterium valens]